MEPRGHASPDWPDGTLKTVPWHRSAAIDDGRKLRVIWVSYGLPLERVDVEEADGHISITLLERYPPAVLPDGSPTAIATIAVTRCVEVELSSGPGDRPILDGTTGRAPDAMRPGPYGDAAYREMALQVDVEQIPCAPRPTGELQRCEDTVAPAESTQCIADRPIAVRFFSSG